MRLGQYGDSGKFLDIVLDGEALRFKGCSQYAISTDDKDVITDFSFASANESWSDLLHSARRTEELLTKRGWTLAPDSRGVDSLPADAKSASSKITDSGAIDVFRYIKGDTQLTVTPSGLWGGVPWWRTQRAKVFWRSMNVSRFEPPVDEPAPSSQGEGIPPRTLKYSATAALQDQRKPATVTFYYTPERTASSVGAIGFSVEVADYESLRGFHFDDFEGPDATASKDDLLEVAIVRSRSAIETFRAAPAGWITVQRGFAFEVSDVFDAPQSTPRRILESLREETDSMTITITDTRDRNVKLKIELPLRGKAEEFKSLLK